MYTIRFWMSGQLISHQEDLDDADLDARIRACETLRGTFVTDDAGRIVSLFQGSTGNRLPTGGLTVKNAFKLGDIA